MNLLCTLGSSWAVVPEAFLLGNGNELYKRVLVLTTAGTGKAVEKCSEWFNEHYPDVDLTILAIANLNDLTCAEDHHTFEEALFRSYFSLPEDIHQIHICLAGGFKTMSSAAHQTADLLGCGKLFHITARNEFEGKEGRDLFSLIDSILLRNDKSQLNQLVNLIDLGTRSGWPTMRELASESPAIPENSGSLTISNTDLREKVYVRLDAANNIMASEEDLATLPFPQIARWSPSQRSWLEQALDPEKDLDWIHQLPKVELHCHLGGFATHGESLKQVEMAAENPALLRDRCAPHLPENWPIPLEPCGLVDYMKFGDDSGSRLLQDPGCLKKHIELLYQYLGDENIHYAEIRCSPGNYATAERSPWQVLSDIRDTFQECMKVATCVPHDGRVLASVSDVEASQPRRPLVQSVGGTLPATATDVRQFIPYNKNAEFTETWRDLPHRYQIDSTVFLTFRLADSLPVGKLKQWHEDEQAFQKINPKPWDDELWKSYRRQFPQRLEAWLDEAHGECLLGEPAVGEIVENALRHFDGDHYILDHFVIMPNHVHVLMKPINGFTLKGIVHSWKSFTAHEINKTLRRSGNLWQKESFDHLLRSLPQLEYLRRYIDENPQKAGLKTGWRIGQGIGLVAVDSTSAHYSPPRETRDATDLSCRRHAATTHVNLIIIATRKPEDKGDYRSDISRHLSLAVTASEHWKNESGCRIVGVDLAGFENKETRAHYFREEFSAVHRCGLALTIHAGENDEAEGIWRAVFDLNTRRIGHALNLIDSPDLLRSVADRNIGVEMCPYANLQIKGYPLDQTGFGPTSYPLKLYLEQGVPVTVNTDNPGISDASLSDNLLLLPRLCTGITRLDVLKLIRNSIDQAFISPKHRSDLLAQIQIRPQMKGTRDACPDNPTSGTLVATD